MTTLAAIDLTLSGVSLDAPLLGDPGNPAELSCWIGTLGVVAYPSVGLVRLIADPVLDVRLYQSVINPPTGQVVFSVTLVSVTTPGLIAITLADGTVLSELMIENPGRYSVTTELSELAEVRVVVVATAGGSGHIVVSATSFRGCVEPELPDADSDPTANFISKWMGYLTTGDLRDESKVSDLVVCFDGQTLPEMVIEPARIFSLAGLGRRKISVWNRDRTRYVIDPECVNPDDSSHPEYILQYSEDFDHFRITGGHQVSAYQPNPQAVVMRAELGGGELGPPVGELPLFPDESPPPGSDFLDGSVGCDRVMRALNGVPGPNLTIYSDLGVLIDSHPTLNRVVIYVNGEGLKYCPDFPPLEQVECLPPGEFCGPAINDPELTCPGPPDRRAGYRVVEDPMARRITETGQPVPFSGLQVLNPMTVPPVTGLSNTQPYGSCEFERVENKWQVIANNSAFNCRCASPGNFGYPGQRIIRQSKPQDADPYLFVRNGFFQDGFAFWQHDGFSLVEDPSEPYGELSNGFLSQIHIPIKSGEYRVQVNYQKGPASLRVKNQYGVELLHEVIEESNSLAQAEFLSSKLTLSGGTISITISSESLVELYGISMFKLL